MSTIEREIVDLILTLANDRDEWRSVATRAVAILEYLHTRLSTANNYVDRDEMLDAVCAGLAIDRETKPATTEGVSLTGRADANGHTVAKEGA